VSTTPLWAPSKASEDPSVKVETKVETNKPKTTLRSMVSRNSHDQKTVAAKEETIISSPGYQPCVCDA